MPSETSFSASSLTKAWRAAGQESLWLRVQTKMPPDVALRAASESLIAANEVEWAATDGAMRVLGEGPSLSLAGPVVYICLAESTSLMLSWVARFAAEMSARGIAGRIGTVRTEDAPVDFAQSVAITTAFTVPIDWVAFDRDRATQSGVAVGWYVHDDTTVALVDALVPLCLQDGGDVFLRHGIPQFRISAKHAKTVVSTALHGEPPVSLLVTRHESDFNRVVFDPRGQLSVARRVAGESWEQTVAWLEELLVGVAPLLEQAVIRRSVVIIGGWGAAINDSPPRLPFNEIGLRLGYYQHNLRHLLAERAVDAYGLQVLADAHLAHATDLSNWDVRTVAPGRHLVKARDLAPWLAGDEPDPQTLAQARVDFGDLILNPRDAGLE